MIDLEVLEAQAKTGPWYVTSMSVKRDTMLALITELKQLREVAAQMHEHLQTINDRCTHSKAFAASCDVAKNVSAMAIKAYDDMVGL